MHAPDRGKPLIGSRLNDIAVGGRHLGQYVPTSYTNAGIPRFLSPRLGGPDAGFRSFGDQRALELGAGAEDLQGKHALQRRRIDRIPQGRKMCALGGEILDYLKQMIDRTRQASLLCPHISS